MSVWKGNTTVNIQSALFNSPSMITYFIITNKSTTLTATINLSVAKITYPGTLNVNISPMNLVLAVGEAYTDNGILVLGGEFITLNVTGNVDYYFLTNP